MSESRISELEAALAAKDAELEELRDPLYCPVCGSCGEPGCCGTRRCKYLNQHQGDYDDLVKDNDALRQRRGRYPFPASFAGASESAMEAIRSAMKCRGFVDVEVSRLEAQPTETGVELIAEERQRQISVEGWTAAHDDTEHRYGDLTQAALNYAEQAVCQIQNADYVRPRSWPWDVAWWKPSPGPIRNLVKAGALIAAEIDRLRRVDASSGTADDQIPAEVIEAMRSHIGPESDAAFIERKIAEAQPEIPESADHPDIELPGGSALKFKHAGEHPTPPASEERHP